MPREDENNTKALAKRAAAKAARGKRRAAEFAEIDTHRAATGQSSLKGKTRAFGGNANSPHSKAIAEARKGNAARASGAAKKAANLAQRKRLKTVNASSANRKSTVTAGSIKTVNRRRLNNQQRTQLGAKTLGV